MENIKLVSSCRVADLDGSPKQDRQGLAWSSGQSMQVLEPRLLLSGTIFTTGFETGDTQPTWLDSMVSSQNVIQYDSGTTMQTSVRSNEQAHAGVAALRVAGNDTSSTSSYSTNKVFSVNLTVSSDTVLSYWVRPDEVASRFMAVDLLFSDGTTLSSYGDIVDETGNAMIALAQGNGHRLTVGQWTKVAANIGRLAGKTITQIRVSYNRPDGTGLFRGYIDDIRLGGGTEDSGDGLTGTYYDNKDFTGRSIVRVDSQINMNWGTNAPHPLTDGDTFSVVWTGKIKPQFSETYTFYVNSNDGARLYVNGQLVVSAWSDHDGEYSGTISLGANQLYDIRLEYYDNTGIAKAELRWSSVSVSKQLVPQSKLYSWTALRTVGNQLMTTDGRVVRLEGSNDAGILTAGLTGAHLLEAAAVSIDAWNNNAIRILLNQDSWFGYRTGQTDGGAAYRQLVGSYIDIARQRGVYVLLCVGWTNAGFWGSTNDHMPGGGHALPDDYTQTFFEDIAIRYGNDPYVLFDLFNEPHPSNVDTYPSGDSYIVTSEDWNLWRNGGTVDESYYNNSRNYPSKPNLYNSYHSPGMQGLLNRIRELGARNMVVAAGLNFDLSALETYELTDTANGYGVLYDSHLYPTSIWPRTTSDVADWDALFGNISSKYPVIVGEVGHNNSSSWNAKNLANVWMPKAMDYIDGKGLSWLGWSMDVGWMVSDWNYRVASRDYGGYWIKDRLGEQFATSFEYAAQYPVGTMTSGQDGWTLAGNAISSIESLNADGHGNAMHVYTPSGTHSVNSRSLATAVSQGTLTVGFDLKVSATNSRTLLMVVGDSSSTGQSLTGAASYLCWGATSGKLSLYNVASGTWTDLANIDADWHRVDLKYYLDASDARKMDVIIDGVKINSSLLAWTNNLDPTANPLAKIHFTGWRDDSGINNGFWIDNVSVRQDLPLYRYTTGGFENTSVYPAGTMTHGQDGWTLKSTSSLPAIEVSGDAHGQVMHIYTPGDSHSVNVRTLPAAISRGKLVVAFDVKASSASSRTLLLRIGDASDTVTSSPNCAAYLCWRENGKISLYNVSAGTWTDLANSDTDWHHVELTLYLDGPQAKTMDFNLDNGSVQATGLYWTNMLTLATNPIKQIQFIGWVDANNANNGFWLDGLQIRHDARTPTAMDSYVGNFEDEMRYSPAPSQMAGSWHQATTEDLGGTREQVLHMATPSSDHSTTKLVLDSTLSSGTLKISFDLKVSAVTERTLLLRVSDAVDSSYGATYLCWGQTSGKISLYNTVSGWQVLGDTNTDWHRVELTIDVANKTQTLSIDGTAIASGIAWSNPSLNLSTNPLAWVRFIGWTDEDNSNDGYWLDNLSIVKY